MRARQRRQAQFKSYVLAKVKIDRISFNTINLSLRWRKVAKD